MCVCVGGVGGGSASQSSTLPKGVLVPLRQVVLTKADKLGPAAAAEAKASASATLAARGLPRIEGGVGGATIRAERLD